MLLALSVECKFVVFGCVGTAQLKQVGQNDIGKGVSSVYINAQELLHIWMQSRGNIGKEECKGISFYKLPTDADKSHQWLVSIMKSINVSPYTYICSLHLNYSPILAC